MFRSSRTILSLFPLLVLLIALRNAPETRSAVTNSVPWRWLQLQTSKPDEHLLIPVLGVRVRQIGNTWQAPRSGNRRHEGQDIFAPKGTPVISATEGLVIREATGGLGGITVSVLGPGGRIYYYAHLWGRAEGLHVGDWVEPGTLLGYVGNTGNARTTPPHLHFGVYAMGGPVNPLTLFRDRPAALRDRSS